jgi:hypothetical protein
MNKKWIFVFVIVSLLGFFSVWLYYPTFDFSETRVINPKLAEAVAINSLDLYYGDSTSDSVEVIGNLMLFDIEGQPMVYEFIFKRKSFEPKNLEELYVIIDKEMNMNKTSTEIRGRYHAADIFTVLIGATDKSNIIVRNYAGLSNEVVNKPKLKKILNEEYSNKNLKLGRLIFVDGLNIYYEVIGKDESIDQNDPVSRNSYLLAYGKDDLKKVSEFGNLLKYSKRDYQKKVGIFRSVLHFIVYQKNLNKELAESESNKKDFIINKWGNHSEKYGIPIYIV